MRRDILFKEDKLHAESEIYKSRSDIYDLFSKAEDNPNKIANFLVPLIKRKVVLDFGCGTGKFIPKLAPLTKIYWAMDISENQLGIAKKKAKNYKNVKLMKNFVDQIPIKSNSIDVVFASWVIGSILDLKLRKKIIEEMKRIIKESGSIYIIENDIGGEYKEIIEEGYGNEKTEIKLKWFKDNGFEEVESFKTYFEFENLESARRIFETIFGKKIASKVKSKKISHNIVIYKNGK